MSPVPATASVSVGQVPVRLAITPDGDSVYVTDAGPNEVSVISTANNTVTATIPVGDDPVDVVFDLNGTHAYLTNAGSNADSVSVINTSSAAVVATMPVGANPTFAAVF